MFPATYWASRYFAPTYFPEAGAPETFPTRYFPPRYFAPRYFPETGEDLQASDNFNRADAELNGSTMSGGDVWLAPSGNGYHEVLSNQYHALASAHSLHAIVKDSSFTASNTLSSGAIEVSGNVGVGVYNTSNAGYVVWRGGSGETEIWKINGSSTFVGSGTFLDGMESGGSDGDDLEIRVLDNGDTTATVYGLVNGVLVAQYKDSSPITSMQPGIYGYSGRVDNWVGSNNPSRPGSYVFIRMQFNGGIRELTGGIGL